MLCWHAHGIVDLVDCALVLWLSTSVSCGDMWILEWLNSGSCFVNKTVKFTNPVDFV